MESLCLLSVLCLLCLCAPLFTCALSSPAGKKLTSWLSFVLSNSEFVTFPLVSWVRCGTDLCTLTYFVIRPGYHVQYSAHVMVLHCVVTRKQNHYESAILIRY